MQSTGTWLLRIRSADENTLRRGRITIVIALAMVVIALLAIPLTFMTDNMLVGFIGISLGIAGYCGAVVLARQGLVTAGGMLLILCITLPVLTSMLFPARGSAQTTAFFLVLPLLIAGLVLRPLLVWAVLALNFAVMALSWALVPELSLADPTYRGVQFNAILLQSATALFSFLGGQITTRALLLAQQSDAEARQAAAQLAGLNTALETRVAERTQALEAALAEVQTRAAAQEQLLSENLQQRTVIRELSVPVLPISDTVLVMPLVGAFDTQRLADVQAQALRYIEQSKARHLLLDITGVPVIDSQVAQGLVQVVAAARLLGARVTLIGIRPEVAQTIVGLGLDLHSISTASDLQSAITFLRVH